jgi:hypothetical protein
VAQAAFCCGAERFAHLRVRAGDRERDRRGRKRDGKRSLSGGNSRCTTPDMTARNYNAALANFAGRSMRGC